MKLPKNALFLSAAVLGLLAVGCSSNGGGTHVAETDPEPVDNGYESDDPSGQSSASRGGAASGGDAQNAGSAAPPSESGAAKDATRAVEEADILKLDGDRLYALSRYGGLSIVDVSNPDRMKLLGRKRTEGVPFEMYVRNGRAYVMLNDFGRYVRDESGFYGQWVQSSEILALDVTDPASVKELSHYDVPGSIADSRAVGDALYLVTYENGWCWRCSQTPATTVTSFDIGGTDVRQVDQLQYKAADKSYASWQRSVSATNERLYIAGPEWSWTQGSTNARSVIQVVDIRDPKGHLVKGADVPVEGQINSRWQMDEYAGVLRVVSQFGNGWFGPNNNNNPRVQTFAVASAQSITPLGATEITLPKPESLRSVRFDGTRAYAITAERSDPLFTVDLSNPAAPKQKGQLEMPGWIFHMEPRGDRLVGFGYEGTNWGSRLAVSLFDVSDLTAPRMLKRVPFGEGWGSVAEDQDRIHKSVRLLDEQGLILVPFASYGQWTGSGCQRAQSGIQLIDWSKDDLVLRGVAPQWGMPRRAFLAHDRLLAISDRNVTSFDIAQRDAPVKKHELDTSNPAYRMVELQDHVVSVTNDWWSGEAMLSVTPKANADDASSVAKLSLAGLADDDAARCTGPSGWTAWYAARLATFGHHVYLTVPVFTYDYSNGTGRSTGRVLVAAIDVADPAKPKLVGKTQIQLAERKGYGWYGDGFWDGYGIWSYMGGQGGGLVGSGTGLVQLGSKLAYLEVAYEPVETRAADGTTTYEPKVTRRLHVLDMADPTAPRANAPIDLGDSRGASPLHLFGSTVLTSRWVKSHRTPGKVRFFVDRVDLAGAAPVKLASINTPGSLLSVDLLSSRWVTTDYSVTRTPMIPGIGCYGGSDYDPASGLSTCVLVSRSFKLSDVVGTKVSLRQTFTPPSQNIAGVQIADDRIYVTRYARYDWSAVSARPDGGYTSPRLLEDGGLWAIGGIRGGQLSIVSQMNGDANWPLAARGSKIAVYTAGGLAVYDTSTATPRRLAEVNLRGYGYSSHVLLGEDRAIASLGEWGLQTIGF